MLIVTRKNNQSIVIDGRITVRIVEIRGNQIRLGIEAPEEVSIRRQELVPKPEKCLGGAGCQPARTAAGWQPAPRAL
jgi:carbon storage regulator